MRFVRKEDNFIVSMAHMRFTHKNVSFPKAGPSAAWLDENGYAPLAPATPPAFDDETETLRLAGVQEQDGIYSELWAVEPKTYSAEFLIEYTERAYRKHMERPITLHNITIPADETTLTRINNKVQAMRIRGNDAELCAWLGIDGLPVDLTRAQLEDLGVAGDEQWQPVFSALPAIFGNIANGTYTKPSDIDAAINAIGA